MPAKTAAAKPDPAAVAKHAGLVYVHHDKPGITRKRKREALSSTSTSRASRSPTPTTVERINKLVIPPGYKDVWICPNPLRPHPGRRAPTTAGGRSTATTRNGARCGTRRSTTACSTFGKALPKIRARINRDLKLDGLPREKVVAARS